MTDDLEPRLSDHLTQRASRVTAAPDVADVHHRIEQRRQRRTRALGAALALALVAGPVAGWAAARSTEPDIDTLTAAGGESVSDEGGADGGSGFVFEDVGRPGSLDQPMELVSERTTDEGIRLVVRSTPLGQGTEGGPCDIDGLVRVGIEDGQLIDVVRFQTSPTGASFWIAGGADGRPMWVLVARGYDAVSATFPDGQRDVAEAAHDVVALAAYAPPGQSADEMVDDVISIEGSTAGAEPDDAREVVLEDGSGGCPNQDDVIVSGPPVDLTMPEPGEPPADEEGARAEIEELFSGYGGRDPQLEKDEHERPNVWLDADTRFREEHPDYLEWAKETYMVPLEIVFTAPDRATVRYELVSDNPEVPAPGERLGEAVLIDGTWKFSIETSCGNVALAGIECDLSIEG